MLLLLVSAMIVAAQEDIPGEPDERVTIRLVQLAIRARSGGDAVTDLRAEEIMVKESGRAMRVAFLEPFVSKVEAPPSTVRLYVGAPGAASDGPSATTGAPRYVLFLVDRDSDYRLSKDVAIEESLAFARERLEDDVRAAVLAYDGSLHLEQGFTADREAVALGLLRAWDRDPRPALDIQARVRGLMTQLEGCAVDGGGDRLVRQGDEQCLRGVMLDYVDERRPLAAEWYDALERLIRLAGGLRQRTTVIAFSHGVAADSTDELIEALQAVYGNTELLGRMRLDVGFGEGARSRLDAVMELALEERVTLHFVDRMPAPSGGFGARQGAALQPGARPMQVAFAAPQIDLEELAAHSGGLFIHDTDLGEGLERVARADLGGYLLGYYADEYLPPDRLARVKVSTTRKGVRIVHRRGYYARPRSTAGILVYLTPGVALAPESEGGGWFQPFTIVVPPERAGYERRGGEMATSLALLFRVEDECGRILAESYHLFGHTYPADVWDAGQAEPLQIAGWTELPEGRYRLSVSLSNPTAAISGEAERQLDIPGT